MNDFYKKIVEAAHKVKVEATTAPSWFEKEPGYWTTVNFYKALEALFDLLGEDNCANRWSDRQLKRCRKVIVLSDGETYSGLEGCKLLFIEDDMGDIDSTVREMARTYAPGTKMSQDTYDLQEELGL